MRTSALASFRALAALSVLCGAVYPALVTGIAAICFPAAAEGSLVRRDGAVVGSASVGRDWTAPRYFFGRPSATATPYDAAASGGSNLGPLNPALAANVRARAALLRADDPRAAEPLPVDLVTASGSGLDPHVSPAAAFRQAARVARLRGLSEERVRELVAAHVEGRTWGVLGEPRVNVLRLNLALDALR